MNEREERIKLEKEREARQRRRRRSQARAAADASGSGVSARTKRNASASEQHRVEQPHYSENDNQHFSRFNPTRHVQRRPDPYPVGPPTPSGPEALHPMDTTSSFVTSPTRQRNLSSSPMRQTSGAELGNCERHYSPHNEMSHGDGTRTIPSHEYSPTSTPHTPDRPGLPTSHPLTRQTPLSESARKRSVKPSIVPRGAEIGANSPSAREPMFIPDNFASAKSDLNRGTVVKNFNFRSKPDPKAIQNSASPRAPSVNMDVRPLQANVVDEEVLDQGGFDGVAHVDGNATNETRRSEDPHARPHQRYEEEEVLDGQGEPLHVDDKNVNDDEAVEIVKTAGADNVVRGKNLRSRVVPPLTPRDHMEREHRTPPPAAPPRKRQKRSPKKLVPDKEASHFHIYRVFEGLLAKEMGVVQLSNNGITSVALEDVVFICCSRMKFIQSLNLSKNFIEKFPIMFENVCMLVKVLNLAANCLTQLDEWVFKACAHNLRQLNLSSNELTELPFNTKELSHLELLDVSMNRLTHLPGGLGELEQLRYLNVADNNLTVLPEDLGFRNSRLTLFNISRNYDFEAPFPEAMAQHAFHMEDVFFDETKLKDSLPRRAWDKPAPELVRYLTQLDVDEIRENWNKREKERLEKLERVSRRR